MTAAATSPRRWFAPVPARRIELVRRLTFGYAAAWLVVRARYVFDVSALPARRFHPVGILTWMDAPPGRSVVVAVWMIALASCAAVAADRLVRVAAPIGAVTMLTLATFTSSYGQVFHTEHLLVLHLAVLAAAVLVEPRPEPGGTASAWPLNLMMSIVVVTYVVAGIAKLRWSGPNWIAGDVLQNWIAVDNLRKLLFHDLYSPIGGWLSSIGWIWPPIALVTIVIELAAPLALSTGRLRTAWLIGAWGFHLGILVVMAISFPYQMLGVAYAAFLPVEVGEQRLAAWRSARRAGRHPPRVTPSCDTPSR